MRTSNLVFEAYLHAWALRYGSDILRNSVRAELRSPDRLVQPLLGYFILLAEAGSSKSISSEDLPFLYGSLRAASTSSSQVQLLVDADPSSIECAFTWPSGEDAIVQLDGQRLHLGNTMSDLVVIAPTSVCVIGSAEQSLVIGPDVRIECASLEVEAPTMRVLTGSEDIEFVSGQVGTPLGPPKLHVDGAGRFRIYGSAAYPFNSYVIARAPSPDRPELREAFLNLRRILLTLRGHKHGEPAKNQTWMDSKIAPGGPKRRLLEFLVENQIITRESGLYVADRSRMAAEGIVWDDLKRGQLNRTVAEFLSRLPED